MSTTRSRPRRARGVLALAPAVALVAACSGSPHPVTPATTAATLPEVTASASGSVVAEPATTSPYSGREGGIGTPVMVVKYDNTPAAQPHRGLTSADIVYVEPVEWGLTRLAAVFSTDMPEVAGPVRSARVSDLDLFAQFGKVAFVFSGAQQRLLPKIQAADWVPMSEDFDSVGFHREFGTGRYAPTNLMASPSEILDDVGDEIAVSSDMGWVFDEETPEGGTKTKRVTVDWENSSVQLRWNAKRDAWNVWMNGQQARDTDDPGVQRASTAIIQYVKQTDSGYGDKFGGVTPMVKTVGHGKGLLLRDGRSYPITWERATEEAPTAYYDATTGEPVVMDPGQLWVLLVDRSQKASVSM